MTQAQALDILKTGANVFLTGEPGSGKTHTVNTYVRYLRERGIEPAITASTGIAATHLGGMTIHSWSGIGIKTTLDRYTLDKITSSEYIAKRVARTKVLIIDEVSMLAPETLTMVDAVCRAIHRRGEAFGAMQVVLVGDFFQLPPIVKRQPAAEEETTGSDTFNAELFAPAAAPRFAYGAALWERSVPITCYLTEQHRQDDDIFLALLAAIRSDTFDDEHLSHLIKRKTTLAQIPTGTPKLYSHNLDVDRVNDLELAKIKREEHLFKMSSEGPEWMVAALKKGCLSPECLRLKIGAVVMFTKNKPMSGFVNGTLGVVTGFLGDGEKGVRPLLRGAPCGSSDKRGLTPFSPFSHSVDPLNYPIIKTRSGKIIKVEPSDWTIEENGKVKARIGQLPLRLAWAITVHKSQGMSLEEAVMDLSQVFEYGQGYVALSRVRRLSGLHLLGWNNLAFTVHPEVLAQDGRFRAASDEAASTFGAIETDELSQIQHNFIAAAGGRKSKQKVNKISSPQVTKQMLLERKSLKEIAEVRKITVGTVIDHIEKLQTVGVAPDVSYLKDSVFSKSRFDKISEAFHKSFTKNKDYKLAPVQDMLGKSYGYDELRLARLFLNNE